MVRRALVALLATLLLLGQPALTLAQDNTPPGPNRPGEETDEPAGSSELYDLAALILNPLDFADEGYGVDDGGYTSLEEDAALIISVAGGRDADIPEMENALEEAGWQLRYFNLIALPQDDPSLYATSVYTSLTLYADEDGAETGYELLTDANDQLGMTETRGGEPVGDDAIFTRFTSVSDDAESEQLDVTFRLGRFVAEINIANWTGRRPPIADINDLAAAMAARLERPERVAGDGLSLKHLLVTGTGVETAYAMYQRLDGDHLPYFAQDPDDLAGEDEFFDDAGVIDTYMSRQTAPAPGSDDDEDFLDLYIYMYRFEDAETAAAVMAEWPDEYLNGPPDGFTDLEEVRRAPNLGDEAAMLTYVYDRDGTPAPGIRFYILIDNVILNIVADAAAGVPQDGFEAVAKAAAECLIADELCAPIRLPRALR